MCILSIDCVCRVKIQYALPLIHTWSCTGACVLRRLHLCSRLAAQPPLSAAPSPVCLSKYCRACSCSCCLSIWISAAVCDFCSGSLNGLEPETSLVFLALIAVTAAHFSAPLRHYSRTHARATSASGHNHDANSHITHSMMQQQKRQQL